MAVFRMYTGDDGHSHIEDQALSSHPILSTEQSTAHITFREMEAGFFMDWHNAPRRQYVIILGGQMEIGFNDGTKRRFHPGDAILASDLTGSGHTTKSAGDGPALVGVVPLAE
jgi:quercetin dioxygenase-like cupin family protein